MQGYLLPCTANVGTLRCTYRRMWKALPAARRAWREVSRAALDPVECRRLASVAPSAEVSDGEALHEPPLISRTGKIAPWQEGETLYRHRIVLPKS